MSNNLIDDFLLNDGPKQDCLVHICKYLSVDDLMALSNSSRHKNLFMEFLNDRVSFATKTFDFTHNNYDWEKVFQYLGPRMQKVNVSTVEFKKFLPFIVEYCVPSKLADLTVHDTIDSCHSDLLDDGLMAQFWPCVNRLEKLTLINNRTEREISGRFRQFFEFFQHRLPCLRSLTLKNFNFGADDFELLSSGLTNIIEINFKDMKMFKDVDQFQIFLDRLTNLQVFVYMNCDAKAIHIEAIADCLSKRFPNLRGFGCSIQQVMRLRNHNDDDHFKFLEKFKHLTEFYLSGPSFMSCKMSQIQNAFTFMSNIKRVSIHQIYAIPRIPVVIRRIARSIKKIVNNRHTNHSVLRGNHRVHVIVNNQQYREFWVIKNIHHFVSLEQVPTSNDFLSEYYEFPSNPNSRRRISPSLFDMLFFR